MINKEEKDMDAYDLYDQSFLIDRLCLVCKSQLISHPDCTTSCSNSECELYNKMIWEEAK